MDQTRIDMRTREGRAMASQTASPPNDSIRASLADAPSPEPHPAFEAAPLEVVAPSGRRISRENRRGFGNQGQKLAAPTREGYFRYWFNDTPGRVIGAQESGYTHVVDPATGKNMSVVVGTQPNGDPLFAYLLEIPQEWRDDDMAALEEKNIANEEAIKSGPDVKDSREAKQFYNTAQGRKLQISSGLSRR